MGKRLTVSAAVYWLLLVCVVSAGIRGAVLVARAAHHWQSTAKRTDVRQKSDGPATYIGGPMQTAPGIAGRRLYPYSIIPGGVLSREELKNAVARDSLVAQHYSDFDVSATRVERLDQDKMFYVSYRMGDRVFWTSKKLRIPKGELLITDGDHQARTRCGNRLSSFMVRPTSPIEPTPQALDGGPAPELYAALQPPAAISPGGNGLFPPFPAPGGSPSTPGGTGVTPPPPTPPGSTIPILSGGGPPITPGVIPPPVGTPEPDGLALLGIGFAAIIAFASLARFRRKRKAPSAS